MSKKGGLKFEQYINGKWILIGDSRYLIKGFLIRAYIKKYVFTRQGQFKFNNSKE